MNTKIIKIDSQKIDHEKMQEAGRLIAEGELVAFPTETVYGLGGDALDPEASRKIYAAKGRPSDNPLIVHIADFEDMYRVGINIPDQAKKLSDAFWPGPLTMIVEKSEAVPDATTGGMDTVAVRMPNHPIALELIRKSGCLIAAPSANTSGRPSPTVLRPGYITPQMLSEVLGQEVVIDPGIIAADDTRKPKAPGMKYKHYAPKADMIIVDGKQQAVVDKINALVKEKQAAGDKVAVIATEETKDSYAADVILCMGSKSDEDAIARHLYKILRECDELAVSAIYSESFATPRIGQAIMNRMLKAAGHQVMHAVDEK